MSDSKSGVVAGSVVYELPIIPKTQVAPAQSSQIVPTSNARETSSVASTETRKRRIKPLAQRNENVKRIKSAEVRRQEIHEAMDKEIAEQRRQNVSLRSNTTDIAKAVDEGNLDKGI